MMTESDLVCKVDTDDDVTITKDVESPSSRSSTPTSTSKTKRARLTFPFGACRVCSDSATGIHYGIATCEGCKGFFKRSILRKEKYRCYFDNACLVNVSNRNRCKSCRFRRCLNEGMSVDGVKMGRIPKLVKERALREQKEQQMRKEISNDKSDERNPRESPSSSFSDRSIENYDPNTMETDIIQLPTSSKIYPNIKNLSENKSSLNEEQTINRSIISKPDINSSVNLNQSKTTKSPTFLPDNFTLDETTDLTEHSTGPLSIEVFKNVSIISNKLSENKSNLFIQLTEDELLFTRFLRWSSYNIYVRHSKRVKQLENRMNQMIHKGINKYPGDNVMIAEYFSTIPRTVEVLVRSAVFYIQELPGMTNMDSNNLHKMILHRTFDWFMLKYNSLFNENGQCYFLYTDGIQLTRHWLNILHGSEIADAMFKFSQHLRELNLNETEFSLVLPLQICHPDPTMEDQDTPRMLRSCYTYALYEELCYNRGEQEGKLIFSKVLQVLELLVPLNVMYEKHIGSRVLEA